MKKKEIKKLKLTRETLQTLTSSEDQKVVGMGSPISSMSNDDCCRPSN